MGKTTGKKDIIQSIKTPLGFFALALLVVEAIFGAVASFSSGSDRTIVFVGMIVILLAVIVIVGFLSMRRPRALLGVLPEIVSYPPPNEEPKKDFMPGLVAVLESSCWPMFFTDLDRKVVRCNNQMAKLLDGSPEEFEGQSVQLIVQRLAEIVPTSRRNDFLERQRSLQDGYSQRRHPHSDESDYLDTTEYHESNHWRGLFRFWIHADRLRFNELEVGYVVIYHLLRVETIPIENAVTEAQP